MNSVQSTSQRETGTVVGVLPGRKISRLAVKRLVKLFNPQTFLAKVGQGKTTMQVPKEQVIFSQGDVADAVFYVHAGRVRLTVVSQLGKEAVVGTLEHGSFFGEGCLIGQLECLATATSLDKSTIVRIEKTAMVRVLHKEPSFATLFMAYLLSRNVRIQADLVDHLFNSAEKRLARILLLMARYGKDGKLEPVIPKITQDTLAKMVGTTRSRISFFMTRFRKQKAIEYKKGHFHVQSSLLNIVLLD